MKNFCLFVLLCSVAILTIVTGLEVSSSHRASCHHDAADEVVFRRTAKGGKEVKVFVKLKRMVDSVLANGNLPIWIARGDNPYRLELLRHVMSDIGNFHLYQDSNNCAAAVYFQKRREFDGVIDNRYIIHRVPYNCITQTAQPSKCNVIESQGLKHATEISSNDIFYDEISNQDTGVYEAEAQQNYMAKWQYVKSRLPLPTTVYIETLIIVNYDMVNKFRNDYAALVSAILVTFNSIDMLYSKLDKPKVKINIAGIILGETRDSFPQLIKSKCYEEYDGNEGINAACLIRSVKSAISKYEKTISIETYDVVVFLTDFYLHGNKLNENREIIAYPIDGHADTPEDHGYYDGYRLTHNHMRSVVVTDADDMYQSFGTIAHEMAHLFNVLHDQGECRDTNGKCSGNIMRTDGSYCQKCLMFSSASQEQFNRFLSSRDGCIFHNYPRSLSDASLAPELFWSVDEQCQCYGYEFADDTQRNLWQDIKKLLSKELDCLKRLKCIKYIHGEQQSFKTGYLMNGTPCHRNKVCWNGKCKASRR